MATYVDELERFTQGCKDYRSEVRVTPRGLLEVEDSTFTLSPGAREQLCATCGVSRRFFDSVSAEGCADVLSVVLEGRKFLVRARFETVRGFLSTRFRPIDNKDVVKTLVPRLKMLKLLTLEDPFWESLQDEYSVLCIPGTRREDFGVGYTPSLVITNSEVGRGALSVRLRAKLEGATLLSDPVIRRTHLLSSSTFEISEALRNALLTLVNALPVIKRNLERTIRFRPFDFKWLRYPDEVFEEMFGEKKSSLLKMNEAREYGVSQLVRVTQSSSISAYWRCMLQRNFFDLLLSFEEYVKQSWLYRWPKHSTI